MVMEMRREATALAVAVAVLLAALAPTASSAGIEDYLTKGSTATYMSIEYTGKGQLISYYIVTVKDKFMASRGLLFKLEVKYLGETTITKTYNVILYELPSYIPLPSDLDVDKIKETGQATIQFPVPVFQLIPRTDPKAPNAYAALKLKLISITTYKLNLTHTVYKIKTMYLRGLFKGYTVAAYIEEKTGLLVRAAFINTKTGALAYEVKLVYFTNMDKLSQTGGAGTTPSGLGNMIPLIIVILVMTGAIIALIIAIRKIRSVLYTTGE